MIINYTMYNKYCIHTFSFTSHCYAQLDSAFFNCQFSNCPSDERRNFIYTEYIII